MKPLLLLQHLRAYEVIAFVAGFSLMVYELVASRLLAPSIGSSTYVWTSVIGVIIAALACGYAIGGWAADKRTKKMDIGWLLIAAAVSVLTTLIFSGGVLELVSSTTLDARLKGLIAATLLFTPTSFLLGTLSPYLVRLHTESLKVAGRSVASLSALNAVGGIVGTFSAGFIFFSFIGAQQTLGLVTALLLAASWLVLPKVLWRQRVTATSIILLCTVTTLAPTAHATSVAVDTATAHYIIRDTSIHGQPARVLITSPAAWQSGIYIGQPDQLAFYYTQAMATMVRKAAPQRILILGGGAFTLPDYLATAFPAMQIDAVEIDPQLQDIAKQYFNFHARPNLQIIAEDGRAYLNGTRAKYDMILVDMYSGLEVPFAVTTTEYVQALRHALTPGGSVLVNVVASNSEACAPYLHAITATYHKTFGFGMAYPEHAETLGLQQNMILAYAATEPVWLRQSPPGITLSPTGQILTDNYAPVERLHARCK